MQLTAGQVCRFGTTLGMPASSTVSILRDHKYGKIMEGSHNPYNVQVLLPKSMEDSHINLRDHKGVF